MNMLFDAFVRGIQFGETQHSGALAVLPVLADLSAGPDYLTLQEALATGTIAITEINEGGSVPELSVVNQGDMPVLLLDGEELAGAKQNRVVNTTILIKAHSKCVIPVSCVEQGRWHNASHEFKDSGNLMTSKLRVKKQQSVSKNMNVTGCRTSDQGEVWDGVHEMVSFFMVESDTGAMKDVYDHVGNDLTSMLRAFTPIPGQRGFAVFINGKIVGIEYISQPRAFAKVFEKLLRSYAMEALQIKKPKDSVIQAEAAIAFLANLSSCDIKSYDAIGHGQEHRVTGRKIVGSALTVSDDMVHLSLLANDKGYNGYGEDDVIVEVPFPRS